MSLASPVEEAFPLSFSQNAMQRILFAVSTTVLLVPDAIGAEQARQDTAQSQPSRRVHAARNGQSASNHTAVWDAKWLLHRRIPGRTGKFNVEIAWKRPVLPGSKFWGGTPVIISFFENNGGTEKTITSTRFEELGVVNDNVTLVVDRKDHALFLTADFFAQRGYTFIWLIPPRTLTPRLAKFVHPDLGSEDRLIAGLTPSLSRGVAIEQMPGQYLPHRLPYVVDIVWRFNRRRRLFQTKGRY